MTQLTPEQINSMFPIMGIIVYPGGVVVQRNCLLTLSQIRRCHLRGVISMVSQRSLNKLALLIRSTEVKFLSVMTPTYGANFPLNGVKVKKDLNHFLISLKRAFGPFEYAWIIEFQERGAPHFHIVTTLAPPSFDERWQFASIWAGISVPFTAQYSAWSADNVDGKNGELRNTHNACMAVHTFPKAWERVRKKGGVGRYFAKYANKLKQKDVPLAYRNVGRFWGTSRGVKMPEGKYYHGSDSEIRQAAAVYGRDISSWKVLPKIILLG